MPLKNLLPKRSSQKTKKIKGTHKDSSEVSTNPEKMSVMPEVHEVLNELIDNVVANEDDGHLSPVSSSDISNFVEYEKSDSLIEKTDSSDEDQIKTFSRPEKKIAKKKTRSVSEYESTIESQTRSIRRRFGSEGEILSICEKIIPPEQQKELNETIGKYIDKLIKDSIFKAVSSVNVDSLYEDMVKDFSNRKSSQSAESEEDYIVEQCLSSNSISELVELENGEESSNDNQRSSLFLDYDVKVSETESLGNEDDTDQGTFGGYLADFEDTTSVDDLKSIEEDSLNSSMCSSGLENKTPCNENLENSKSLSKSEYIQKIIDTGIDVGETVTTNVQTINDVHESRQEGISLSVSKEVQNNDEVKENISENAETIISEQKPSEPIQKIPEVKDLDKQEQKVSANDSSCGEDQKVPSNENICDSKENLSEIENTDNLPHKSDSTENNNENNISLIVMSPEEESLLLKSDLKTEDNKVTPLDVDENVLQQNVSEEEASMKVNWKVGNLHIKLPHKTRGKGHLKAWKKRRVVVQPDEFVNDPKNPSLVISVYGSDSKKHETSFWHSVSCQKATIFRSSSRTHRYAFTISESDQAIIHLSAESESATQEWMAAIRAVLWPPSPFMELEKMLSGREFEISIIDNEFSYHAGLLGMYGYLSITPKKLILLHPQQGYVIQEWYLNTVDKFQLVPQPKSEDVHKVLSMKTCSDSSTGQGDIIFYCNEAVTLLQSLASSIHEVLSYHSKQEGGKYKKELEEIAEWLVAPPQDCLKAESDEHYKVPPRQVKSLLDIPNFIFNKSLSPVSSAIFPAPNSEIMEPLATTKSKPTTTSQDSGISACTSSDDFLNCSTASFIIGGGPMTGKSSDSELSDAYTPPRTPEVKKKTQFEVVKEEQLSPAEA